MQFLNMTDKTHVVRRIVFEVKGTEEEVEKLVASLKGLLPTKVLVSPVMTDLCLETTIEEIRKEKLLSSRACNVITKCGVQTVADLIKKSEHDLLMKRNCGKKTIEEIANFLMVAGLELRPYIPRHHRLGLYDQLQIRN